MHPDEEAYTDILAFIAEQNKRADRLGAAKDKIKQITEIMEQDKQWLRDHPVVGEWVSYIDHGWLCSGQIQRVIVADGQVLYEVGSGLDGCQHAAIRHPGELVPDAQ